MARPVAAALAAALLTVFASGCETTRERAAKLGRGGNAAFQAEGVAVRRANRDVRVLSTTVVSDANGGAVVAFLRNDGRAPLSDVPLALVVRDARGRALARNDAPGLERGLTHAALLPVGRAVPWVHDQVLIASGRPARAEVTPGAGGAPPARPLDVAVEGARIEGDPSSGATAVARAVNRSATDLRDLLIVCVARRGERVVAAGRAIVPSLKAGRRARFQVFFIGDPTGAELTFDAQPSTAEAR